MHIYAADKGASLGYGHKWVPPDVAEMVRWTAIPIHRGSLDGMPGTLTADTRRLIRLGCILLRFYSVLPGIFFLTAFAGKKVQKRLG